MTCGLIHPLAPLPASSADLNSFSICYWTLGFSFKCKTEVAPKQAGVIWIIAFLTNIYGELSMVGPGHRGGGKSSPVTFTALR